MQPDRVVVGADARRRGRRTRSAQLYEPLDCPVVRTDVASAEMIKLASNAFLATKISFINEIANVCEEVGADVGEVAAGMGLDPRIGGSFLNAGRWLRGLLFPEGRVGAEAARRQLRLPLPAPDRGDRGQRASEAARREQAEEAPRLAGRQADRAARASPSSRNTDDMREASSVVLAARLQGEGALVRAYDPVAEERARRDADRRRDVRLGAGRGRRRRRGRDRDRVAGVRRARPGRGQAAHGQPGDRGRPQHAERRRRARAPGFVYEGIGRT